jgi:hypothetical protein
MKRIVAITGMILLGIPLLAVLLLGIWFGWSTSFITLKIPDDFTGPILIKHSPVGSEGRGFWKWRVYDVPSEGIVRTIDIERFYNWHVLKAERRNGTMIAVHTPPGDFPEEVFLFNGPSAGSGQISSSRQFMQQSTKWYFVGTEEELRSWASTKPW